MSSRNAISGVGPRAILALLPLLLVACASPREDDEPPPFAVVYSQDFAGRDALAGFAFSDPDAWRWSREGDRTFLELLGNCEYEPPHRSPTGIALIPDLLFRDFDLEVDLQQTGIDTPHRDMCLFFGFQSPARFYYAHIASIPDQVAHHIHVVKDAPRTPLSEIAEHGVDWGRGVWHRVRIERRVDEGTIRVYWDGSEEPILSATDTSFDWGRIGFGSFDDSGRITNIRIHAPAVRVYSAPGDPFR